MCLLDEKNQNCVRDLRQCAAERAIELEGLSRSYLDQQ
jgi:hypothetical protein